MTTDTRPRSVADLQDASARRTIEQKVYAEPVTVRLGGTDYQLRLLTISEAKAWKADASTELARLLSQRVDSPGELVASIVGGVMSGQDRMLDLITDYDRDGVLPDRQALEDSAVGPELDEAFLAVMAVAFPFGRLIQRLMRGLDQDKLVDALRQLVEAREREQARQRLMDRTASRSTQS